MFKLYAYRVSILPKASTVDQTFLMKKSHPK